MKIVVVGGTGLTGRKLVDTLRRRGHEAVAASRASGVDAFSGDGLHSAVEGASVVVDVTSPPSPDAQSAMTFFETSTRNLLAAESTARVGHHVVLSIVGLERLLAGGYFRAKLAQEELVRAGPIPYTIARATQFFEFVGGIADAATHGSTVRIPPIRMQPVAADDVADVLAGITVGEPLNATVEIAGPDVIRQDELVRLRLAAGGDSRAVVADPDAHYFGVPVDDLSLVPGNRAVLGTTRFAQWLGVEAAP